MEDIPELIGTIAFAAGEIAAIAAANNRMDMFDAAMRIMDQLTILRVQRDA